MKKLILTALAATLTASPLLAGAAEAAPFQHRGRTVVVTERTVVREPDYRDWHRGDRFDRRHARNYSVIRNYRAHRLTQPMRGAYWARSGRDAVLLRNGQVVEVRQRYFR